jgi:hypothetical protein
LRQSLFFLFVVSFLNLKYLVPVAIDATPTHNHGPVPEAASEPSPEPEPVTEAVEPARTFSTSTTTLSSYNINHQLGPIPEHTTFGSQQSRHPDHITEAPTTQPSPSRLQEHLGQPDDTVGEYIPVTVETALSEPTDQAHEIALDPESSQISSPQVENKTHTLHVVEGNSTETSENSAKYFAEVPASVQVIYDDTAHVEHDVHSPPYDHDILESTSSPHFYAETQTLTVSIIDGNHSQATYGPYKMTTLEHFMTDSPVEMITRHELNGNVVAVSSQSPESLMPHKLEHDDSNTETSVSLPNLFIPSEERHTGVDTVATTNSPVTSHPVEHHTALSAGTSTTHSENEAEPTDYPSDTEKKRGFVYDSDGNRFKAVNSSVGKTSEIAGSLGNSAEDPVFISHGPKMEGNSSKFEVTEVPTVIPVNADDANHSDVVMTGHANMLIPSTDNVTKILPGSRDETATVLPIDVAEGHEHDSVLSNDLYFPIPEHAENDTLLNALSPEDYDSHPLQPVTVTPRMAENVPNPNLKKGPRLDDDEMFQVNPNEKNDHEITSEAAVALSSASPVTETHVSDFEQLPPLSDNSPRPNISAGEVREHWNVEHYLKATNNSSDISIAADARENVTEPVTRETAPKFDEHDLSAMLKGTGSQVTTDDMLAVSAMEDAEVPAITIANQSVDVSATEVPVIRPEEVPTHSMATDAHIVTVPEPESVTTHDSNLTSPIFVHDSSISSERDVSSPSKENVIEDGDSLHPGLLNTTTEAEADHPLTVAPLREHLDSEAIPPRSSQDREIHKAQTESGQATEMTTQVESVNATAESMPNSTETSTTSPSDSPVTQSVVRASAAKTVLSLSSESGSEPDSITTVIPHEENDISSGGEMNSQEKKTDIATSTIPQDKQLDATQPENEVVVNIVQNVTQDGETKLPPPSSDSEATADSADETDKEDSGRNVTVGRQTDSSPLHESSSEEATRTTSPEEIKMNQTEGTKSATKTTTTEMPLESDNEAEDTDSWLGKPEHEHLNTVKPLPLNISSIRSEYKSIMESTLLSATNGTDENVHGDLATGDTDHGNAAFEKPHTFTDIENKLLVESGMSTSFTTEYANEIHALHPSGGSNIIPPTAQSVMPVDPVTGEILTPTSIDKLKNETFSTIMTESNSAVEHIQQGKDSTALKVEKDLSVVSIKKKDFLNGSVNKKPLKPISEISSTQGENEQLITDKSVINLYEKKTADKLQKFDKDNSKKIDKMGFAALPVSVEEFDPTEDMIVSMATKGMSVMSTSSSTLPPSPPGGKSMTEASGSVEEESRPVDEEDENEDPLVHLRSDVERVNVVEPNSMAKKEKKSEPQRTRASGYEGEMVMNGTHAVADDEHATEPAIGVGVEPAVSLAANETMILTGDLLTPRILHDSNIAVPLRTQNESVSSSTASNEEKATVVTLQSNEPSSGGKVEDDTAVGEVPFLPSSGATLQVAGNSAEMSHNDGNVVTTPEEGSNSYAPTTGPSVEQSTTVVPAITAVTLNSEDLAKLQEGMNVPRDNGDSQNSTRNVNATVMQVIEDMSPAGQSNGVTHQWTPENGTAVGGNVVEEVPVAFSKCASG